MNEKARQETNPNLEDNPLDELAIEEFDEAVETVANESAEDHPGGDATEQTIIEKLKSALEESEKRALIAVADLENYRKRASKNAQEQIKYAALPLMAELLEAVDNLNRAIESAAKDKADSGLLEGVKMVSDQILNILKSNHCSPIESVGQTFDPNLHQAVQMQPSEEFDANVVMLEMRTGYQLHDRVIRPSQVFVSTGGQSAESSES